jgi:hypothetical protein
MPQVCFDSSTFYTVIIVGLGVIAYVLTNIYQQKLSDAAELNATDQQVRTQSQANTDREQQDTNLKRGMFSAQVQRLEDMQRMHHPLTPPVRRGPFSYTGSMGPTIHVNTPTRGEYGSFQQMGFLHNANDPDQAMPLVGRRIHSNQYEYYTFHHNNPQIKIPIKLQGNKELNDGEDITVYGYANPLQVKIYDLDAPRYIPY